MPPKICAKCGKESPWANQRNLRRYHGWTRVTLKRPERSPNFDEELWLCKECGPKEVDPDAAS